MKNYPLRSKTLRRNPKRPAYLINHLFTPPQLSSKQELLLKAWRFKPYLTLKYVYGVTVPFNEIYHSERATYEALVVQFEGTLISDFRRQDLICQKSFDWEDYYTSINIEHLNVRHLPLIRDAAELRMKRFLICSTPQSHQHLVEKVLLSYGIQNLFTSIICKNNPRIPTQQFLRRELRVIASNTYSGDLHFISDTHDPHNYHPYATYV